MSTKFSGSMDLEKLIHVKRKMKGKDGSEQDVLVIPVKANGLYVGEKTTNLNFELVIHDEVDQYDNDGFIAKKTPYKTLFGKDKKWADLTDEQKEQVNDLSPIMGNFRTFGESQKSESFDKAPDLDSEEVDDILPF